MLGRRLGQRLGRVGAIPRAAWRDAGRLAAQSALSAVLAYLAIRLVDSDEAFLAVLSAAGILHPSVGGTMGEAMTRLRATAAGSVMGMACLFLLPQGWGTAAALGLCLFVAGGAAALRPAWSYASVAAVGIALGTEGSLLEAAVERGTAVAVGAAIGVAVSVLLWPDRAERRFERHLAAALRATARRLADVAAAAAEPGHEPVVPEHVTAYQDATWLAQEALEAARFVDRAAMERRLRAVRRLHDSVVILDRAAEAAPLAGAERLREQAEVLRRDACDLLTALAEGRRAEEGPVEEMDRALGALRAAMAEDDPASELHPLRSALAFGLREVRRTLAEVIEASRAQGDVPSG